MSDDDHPDVLSVFPLAAVFKRHPCLPLVLLLAIYLLAACLNDPEISP